MHLIIPGIGMMRTVMQNRQKIKTSLHKLDSLGVPDQNVLLVSKMQTENKFLLLNLNERQENVNLVMKHLQLRQNSQLNNYVKNSA